PSPASDDWYTAPLNITLTCTDATSNCTTTRYRVDDGAWTDYGTPILFNQDGIRLLQYDSTDTAGNHATGSTTIKLDLTPPTLNVTSPSDPVTMARTLPRLGGHATVGPSSGTVDIKLRNTTSGDSWDGAAFTLDGRVTLPLVGGAWEALSGGALPALLPEGPYELGVSVMDGAGRVSSIEVRTIYIDRTAPTVTLEGAAGARAIDHVQIIVDAVDQTPTSVTAIETRFAAPGALFDSWSASQGLDGALSAPMEVPLPMGDGRYEIRAVVRDAVGNEATSAPLGVVLDTLPPVLALTSPSRTFAAEASYNATFSVRDMSAIASLHVEVTRDGGAPIVSDLDPTAPWLLVPVHASTRSLDYVANATDALGHETSLRGRVQFLDASAPAVSIVLNGSRGDAGWYVGPVTAAFRTDTPGATTYFRVSAGGVPSGNFTQGASFVVNGSGEVTLDAYASIARAGTLVESAVQTQVVHVDLDDPTGSILAPASAVPDGQRVKVRATAGDATSGVADATLEVIVGGTTRNVTLTPAADGWEADVGPFRSTDAPTLRLFITDQASRRALVDSRALAVKDQTPPLVSLVLPDGPLRQIVRATASASDESGIAFVRFMLDGETIARIEAPPFEVTFDTTRWANEPHVLNATAQDAAGNEATDPRTIQIANPPTICCLQVAPGSAVDPVMLQVEANAPGGREATVTLYHRLAGDTVFENVSMTPAPCPTQACQQRTYTATLPGHPIAGTTLEVFALAQDGSEHATAPTGGLLQVPIRVAQNATLDEWRDAASARFAENDTQYTPDGAADIVNASILAMPTEILFGVQVREPFSADETRTYLVELAPGKAQPLFAYVVTYNGTWHLSVKDFTSSQTRDQRPGELSLEPREREFTLRARTSDVRALMGDDAGNLRAKFHTFGSEDFTSSRFIDVTPPIVQHAPPAHAPRGATLHLNVTLSDNANAPGALRATIIPLLGGASLDPVPVVDGHADLPTSGGLVKYVIAASDVAGNLAVSEPYTVALDDVTPPRAVASVVGASDVSEDTPVQL
ncbi:MAG: Ig-like domain-containing protein, partial [Candidatus Thermoplasmatota archaeon]